MEKKTNVFMVGDKQSVTLAGKKVYKKATRLSNYVRKVVKDQLHYGAYVMRLPIYKKKLPDVYFTIEVVSYKNVVKPGKKKYCKFTNICISTMVNTNNGWFDWKVENNTVTTTCDNLGNKTWRVMFYLKANDMKYTRDEIVAKTIKYAKKKGVKIYKNIDIQ